MNHPSGVFFYLNAESERSSSERSSCGENQTLPEEFVRRPVTLGVIVRGLTQKERSEKGKFGSEGFIRKH